MNWFGGDVVICYFYLKFKIMFRLLDNRIFQGSRKKKELLKLFQTKQNILPASRPLSTDFMRINIDCPNSILSQQKLYIDMLLRSERGNKIYSNAQKIDAGRFFTILFLLNSFFSFILSTL